MFTTLIVRPIFNLLVLILALLPRHNFGVAIIIFTIVVRLLMWPLVKKQLHSAKIMRDLAPELKRVKKAAGGDRQKESVMVMELYKEKGVNPFSSFGLVILQIPILFGLYAGLRKLIADPRTLITFSYPFIRQMGFLKELALNIGKFDHTFLGFIDLTRPAVGPAGFYLPAFLLVVSSAFAQYYQSKMLLPSNKDSRKLRDILKDAGKGEQADSSEVNAAVGRSTQFIIPIMIFVFTINIASALSLYWLVSGIVAILQQRRVFNQDETEMETSVSGVKVTRASAAVAEATTAEGVLKASSESLREAIEGEIIEAPQTKTSKAKTKPANRASAKKGKKKHRRR